MTKTLADVLSWAETTNQSYDAICELKKVPARLGLYDQDLGAISAELGYFEAAIVPSSYAPVSKSGDLKAASRRGNARLRALLTRFWADGETPAPSPGRAEWNALVAYVAAQEGPPGRGAPFNTHAARGLFALRSLSACAPADLSQAEIVRIAEAIVSGRRKALCKSIAFLNKLIAARAEHPEIAALLPTAPLAPPGNIDRARRIAWDRLPRAVQTSITSLIDRAVETVADQAGQARARIAAGEDRADVLAEFETQRTRTLQNRAAARSGYRMALTWVLRAALARGLDLVTVGDVREFFTLPMIEAALTDQIARSRRSQALKDPEKSQTIQNRLTALLTLARHGLRDAVLAEDLGLLAQHHAAVVVRPGQDGMIDEIERFCQMLLRAPHVAANLVNAPARIAAKAEAMLAVAEGSEARQITALRLYASAVMFAIQMSRPVRSGNLIKARLRSTLETRGHLVRLKSGGAELHFPRGEVKNDRPVIVAIRGGDAAILARWVDHLRPRLIKLRGLDDNPYLFPGASLPRLLKDGVVLPKGCLSPSTFAEIWQAGAEVIGIDMTPHMARHAVATLILAMEPGNYAKAASVLGDAEATVRKHYGLDSGEAAAKAVRGALLRAHPDLFRLQTRRAA